MFFFLFILFIQSISTFFNISDHVLLIITDLTILVGFLYILNLSLLQAKLAFRSVALTNLFIGVLKVLIGIGLVYFGFAIRGAIFAIFVSFLIPYIFTFTSLRFLFSEANDPKPIHIKELINYGIPSTLALLGVSSMISNDILLMKHFVDAHTAGMYAGLSLVAGVS